VNEPEDIIDTQTGQENGNLQNFKSNNLYYSFTTPSAQLGSHAESRILAQCVRGASLALPVSRGITGSIMGPESAQKPRPISNAFLTLSAVTQW
jgi:hypothetical protein